MTNAKILEKSNYVKASPKLLGFGILAVTITIIPEAADPFNTPKLIILFLLGAWMFGNTVSFFRKNSQINTSLKSPVILFSLFFCCALIFAALFSDEKIIALIGDTQRRNGLLAYLSLVSIFLYTSFIGSFRFITKLFIFTLWTCLVVAAYGVIQIAGFDFINWNNPYNNMISTLGNPNFASSLLAIFVIVLFFGINMTSYSNTYKIFSLLVIVISIVAIVGSESLQGILILFFSTLVYISLYFQSNKLKFYKPVLIVSFALTAFAILGIFQKGPFRELLYKDSVSIRGYYWRAGIEMFNSNPVFGVGLDNYGDYFKQYREPGYVLKYGYEISSNNAHNTIIQLFATGGILVGISYLLILIYVLYSGIKLIYQTSGNDQKIAIAVFSAWMGFNSQSLISIDNIAISIWGWVLGGSLIGMRKQYLFKSVKDKKLQAQIASRKLIDVEVFRPVLSTLILIPTLILSLNLFRSETDLYKLQSLSTSYSTEFKPYVKQFAEKIISNRFSDPWYKYQSAVALIKFGFIVEGNQAFNKLFAENERNLIYLSALAISEEEGNNLIKAIKFREQIAVFDPWNANNYEQLYFLYSKTENDLKAKEIKDKLLSFAPESDQAKSVMKAEVQS